VRLGRLRRRQGRGGRRVAHTFRRRAPGQRRVLSVVFLGGRRAGFAGAGALMALAVPILVLGAVGAALAVRVLLAAAAVRVGRRLHGEEAAWSSLV